MPCFFHFSGSLSFGKNSKTEQNFAENRTQVNQKNEKNRAKFCFDFVVKTAPMVTLKIAKPNKILPRFFQKFCISALIFFHISYARYPKSVTFTHQLQNKRNNQKITAPRKILERKIFCCSFAREQNWSKSFQTYT